MAAPETVSEQDLRISAAIASRQLTRRAPRRNAGRAAQRSAAVLAIRRRSGRPIGIVGAAALATSAGEVRADARIFRLLLGAAGRRTGH